MLESSDQLPHAAIERSGDAGFFTTVDNRAVHKIDFGLALGESVLQHAGVVLAGSVCAFFDKSARIAVKLDAESFGHRFALGDEGVEKRVGGGKARGSTMMQQSDRADRIGGGVEDKCGPLRAAPLFERDDVTAASDRESGARF